jgi:hypothetical protein
VPAASAAVGIAAYANANTIASRRLTDIALIGTPLGAVLNGRSGNPRNSGPKAHVKWHIA